MKKQGKKYKLGLVLSGGAVRGFAHAGVLKALNEEGFFPDVISCVSAGSIVGSLYADGYTPDQIFKIFADKSIYKFLEFIVPNRGLLKITGLYKTMLNKLRSRTFEELKIPLIITVTDLNNAKCVYFSSGDLARYVIASCSIPIMFQPVVIDGIAYVDGGVINNFPVEPIIDDCEKVIGVNINPVSYQESFSGMMAVADRAVHIMIESAIKHKKQLCWMYIEPPDLRYHGILDMTKGREMFRIGYEETKKVISNSQKNT